MQFFVDNSIYVTLIICMMILIGVLIFMSRIDARVRRMETKLDLDTRTLK